MQALNTKLFKIIKGQLINVAVLMIILMGLGNILLSQFYKYRFITSIDHNYAFFSPQLISLHRTVSTIIGFILIFISFRLFKRVRTAWIITLALLPLSIFLQIFSHNRHLTIIIILEVLIIIILIAAHNDFKRKANPLNLKWGFIIAFISIFLVVFNTAVGLFLMKSHFKNINDFIDSFKGSLELLYFMDFSDIEPKSKLAVLFGRSSIIINWVCIGTSLFLILKPLIYQPIVTIFDKEKIREYLKLYGFNPISYIAIENDKKYFFGDEVQGAIAYVIAGGVAVCAGDPICDEKDTIILLSEFITFCRQNAYDICFCQVTSKYLEYYKAIGFGIAKYGEEAIFDLAVYDIKSGGKTAKIRNAINHANRLGIEVFEYNPNESKDRHLEEQITKVSKEWLAVKKTKELSFMMGSVGLENPMERRYFVAADADKKVLGFIVFTPFLGGKGYHADVTRRRNDAPIGVMEKLVITAFNTMKAEGVIWGSLGLAPLHNVRNSTEQKPIMNVALTYVYEHMNNIYGFKTLYHYKNKYAPTEWRQRFLAYYPNVFTPKIAIAIVKAQLQ
jgi:phosphatidylglycerol lysyltransferase